MKQVSASEMQAIDRQAIEDYGIPSLLLMENAGRGIAELIFQQTHGKRVSVLAGGGHNGGDGFVAARHLHNRGYKVFILLFAEPTRLKADSKVNYEIALKMKIPVQQVREDDAPDFLSETLRRSDIVVDALFGVGLTRPLTGVFAAAVEALNAAPPPGVVAVDIPSGIQADTGAVLGCAVKATLTATLGLPKLGLSLGEGPAYAGKIALVDISLPRELL